jgi:hypothetical protein
MAQFRSLWDRKARYQKGRRPVLDLTRTPLELALELIAAGALVGLCALLAQAWPVLADRVPQHFGPNGRPDAWGSRNILWLFPAMAAGNYVLMTILNRFPHTFNYPWPITEQNAEAQYLLARTLLVAVKAEIGGLMLFLEWKTIEVALGRSTGLGEVFLPTFLSVIVLTMALYFVKAYRAR